MNRYAIVQGNDVINVVLWDDTTYYEPDGKLVAIADGEPVGPGWMYINNVFVAPIEENTEEA